MADRPSLRARLAAWAKTWTSEPAEDTYRYVVRPAETASPCYPGDLTPAEALTAVRETEKYFDAALRSLEEKP